MKKNNSFLKNKRNDIRFYFILFLTLITGVVLIYSTYAWFSSSLNVQIYGFNVHVDHDSDLAISLDGENWQQSINISKNTLINDLNNLYPGNTNRWSEYMSPVSTVGLLNNGYKFSVYENKRPFSRTGGLASNEYIYPKLSDESKPVLNSNYFAFDIFIRNNTGSPFNDNLYIRNEKNLFVPETEDDEFILKAIRFGMVYVGTVDKKSSLGEIQSINCNVGDCKQFIYEADTTHTDGSIEFLKRRNINITNNSVVPTYGIYNEGEKINLWSGVYNSNVAFDSNIFSFQNTITNLDNSVFELPSGISKFRIYLWIEGEDIDIIKTDSPGYRLIFKIDFEKDTAGYK